MKCEKFGSLTGYELKNQTVELDFEGIKAEVKVLTPQIINVFCGGERIPSKAIEGDKTVAVSVSVEKKTDGLWISTGEASVRVSDGFFVDFFDRDGKEVCTDYRGERKPLQRVSNEMIKVLEKEVRL